MNKKLDDIIKRKLDNFDSPYPDHMWKSIANNLPEKKRKSYYLWFLVFFIAILSYSVTYYSFRQLTKENTGKSKKGAYNQKAVESKNGTLAINDGSVISEPSNENLGGENIYNEAGFERDENGHSDNKNLNNNSYNIYRKSNSHTSPIDNLGSIILFDLSSIESAKSESLNSNNSRKLTDEAIQNENIENKNSTVNISSLTNGFTTNLISSFQNSTLDSELNSISKKHATLACPTFVKKQNLTTLEVYFSNEFAERTLKIKRGDALNYINLRNKTEVSHLSNSFGFRIGMGWESGIAFKTGLNFSTINEKFIYTDPNSIQKKTITVIKYIYDDKFNVVDSTVTQEVVEIPGTNTIVTKNRYSFIDIPILFQYSIPGKKRLSYDATFGPYVNLMFNQSGKILDNSGKSLVNLDEDDGQNLFKNNIGLSFYSSFAVNYQLTKRMKISLEPNVRFMTSSVTSFTNSLDQKYLTAGVSAGIKMKI